MKEGYILFNNRYLTATKCKKPVLLRGPLASPYGTVLFVHSMPPVQITQSPLRLPLYHTYRTIRPCLYPHSPLNPPSIHSFKFRRNRSFRNRQRNPPPIKHNPPSGVTGPKNLQRCGSR